MCRHLFSTLRREAHLAHRNNILASLGLRGFTHVSGLAGSGKTMLAVAIAADSSCRSRIEWINTDSKTRFIQHLKATISHLGGTERNVAVNMTKGHKHALEAVLSLPSMLTPDVSLVVVDPITRVIDMARRQHFLWGQELIEDALPTLAGLSKHRSVDILVMSEMRTIPEVGNIPVHSNVISKWTDNVVRVRLNSSDNSSSIYIEDDGSERAIGQLKVLEDGACHLSISQELGVATKCLEKEF